MQSQGHTLNMFRWEALEEYEFDDLLGDLISLTAKTNKIDICMDKKRSTTGLLTEVKGMTSDLKESLLKIRQRPMSSPKATKAIFIPEVRMLVRKLFIHVEKGPEIGREEQFTTILRSLAESLRNSMRTDDVHLNTSSSKEWVPEADDTPQSSMFSHLF